jgi:hypothetical protein
MVLAELHSEPAAGCFLALQKAIQNIRRLMVFAMFWEAQCTQEGEVKVPHH